MSGYNRILKLKNCFSPLNSIKRINKLNESLGKKLDSLCSKPKAVPEVQSIKKVNHLLTKELNNATEKIRTGLHLAVSLTSENARNCESKLKEACKPLYAFSATIEDNKRSLKKKYLKSRHIKKEAQKLLQHLAKSPQVYGWSASGLSLQKDSGTAALNTVAQPVQNQAMTVWDAIDNEFVPIKSARKLNDSYPATVLDKELTLPDTGTTDVTLDPIPEPPAIPDLAVETLPQLNALGEPTFASQGLGGWSPVGIVQNCMEFLHASLGLDWWVAIVLGTLVIRICLFPLVVLAQRNAAKMNNYMPQMQMLQMKLTEARQSGDSLSAARYSQELMMFMKEKGLNPLKNMIVPLAQAPIFISFFMGLRQMANVPVDSLRQGGIFWFTDLTLPDQYFLLPIITSTTLWLTIELGTDSAKLQSQNMVLMKYALRALPLIILPFTVNFPGVILCYWVSTNFISMAQVACLRIPAVRDYFKIEPLITFKPEQLPVAQKGFTEGLKDSWTNIKITRELEERRRLDEMQFNRAGKGPIQKTYKYDPTRQSSPNSQAPISAKKR